MKTKSIIIIGLVMVLVLSLVAACTSEPAAPAPAPTVTTTATTTQTVKVDTFTWNLHLDYTQGSSTGGKLTHWADTMEKVTDGRVKVNVFYGGSLGYGSQDILPALKTGALDAAYFTFSVMPKQDINWWDVNGIIGLFESYAQERHFYGNLRPLLDKALEEYGGVKIAGLYGTDDAESLGGLWMTDKITSLSDFKGKKFRVFQALAREKQFPAFGASGIYLASSECYSAMKTSLIDGVFRDLLSGLTSHYPDVAKYYYSMTPKAGGTGGVIFSEASLNALPADLQKLVLEANKEHDDFINNEVLVYPSKYVPNNLTDPPGYAGQMDIPTIIKELKATPGFEIYRVPKLTAIFTQSAKDTFNEWADAASAVYPDEIALMKKLYAEAYEKYPGITNQVYLDLPEMALAD